MLVLQASGTGSFGFMSKDLMVLAASMICLTGYLPRVHLHCSLRPLMYGMTTLVPTMNSPVEWFGFLMVLCWGLAC